MLLALLLPVAVASPVKLDPRITRLEDCMYKCDGQSGFEFRQCQYNCNLVEALYRNSGIAHVWYSPMETACQYGCNTTIEVSPSAIDVGSLGNSGTGKPFERREDTVFDANTFVSDSLYSSCADGQCSNEAEWMAWTYKYDEWNNTDPNAEGGLQDREKIPDSPQAAWLSQEMQATADGEAHRGTGALKVTAHMQMNHGDGKATKDKEVANRLRDILIAAYQTYGTEAEDANKELMLTKLEATGGAAPDGDSLLGSPAPWTVSDSGSRATRQKVPRAVSVTLISLDDAHEANTLKYWIDICDPKFYVDECSVITAIMSGAFGALSAIFPPAAVAGGVATAATAGCLYDSDDEYGDVKQC